MKRLLLTIGLFMLFCGVLSAEQIVREFRFGGTKKNQTVISLREAQAYTDKQGYGFEFSTEQDVRIDPKNKSLFSEKPFYFSVKVPEGNYKITIIYHGLSDKPYRSTVRSESRRLQIENQEVLPNKSLERTFIVHIKDPKIASGETVRLKMPRERHKLDWDDKLTFEFQQTNCILAIRIEAISNVPTVFLAGNSTVVNQEDEPWASWGQMIPRFFDAGVAIANHAESGLALSSFLSSKRLEKILSVAKSGDYLLIEFGHNDQKEKGENAGAYKGYSERLRYFVREFRAKGGIPVILTSTARRSFDEQGHLVHTLGDFPDAARKVAAELQVPLIDLNKKTSMFYEALGVEGSKRAFVHYPAHTYPNQENALADNTHFNPYGAYEIAKMVLTGIKENQLAIAGHIIDFQGFDPQHPDDCQTWYWPPSLVHSILKPDGN
ncbi:rhamnogalacturonan acetylesterase [Sphingobacterium thalpophilum]|uniref:Rhamnogalacturonan acetylesterase rhgT n=1 Tax=Sphingobacterium thalpophilum TaxID=259 RepID=A0A4U9UYJ0_9SPHI|nr:rhamnogalacturonan acetylesterase [Sphingobacterium thalpophilum]VTR39145.1 Rhamnogalacturonan acetylesterase rhgT [Sphingobacterium thalpophilum]